MNLERVTLEDWITAFVAERGGVTGEPLYRYGCTREEFEELRDMLRNAVTRNLPRRGPQAAALCLFLAEWWRREFRGGSWSWDTVLSPLGLSVAHVILQQLYSSVRIGLAFWKRSLVQISGRRQYLGTLACEGGLPLNLLKHPGSGLRRYFRALLEDYALFQRATEAQQLAIATNHGTILPMTFQREEVYTLAAELTREVQKLQHVLGDEAESTDALARLDLKEPGWRARIPLDLADHVALNLVQGLVLDAQALSRRRARVVRLDTVMARKGGEWILSRSVTLPGVLSAERLRVLLGYEEPSLPGRFQLYAEDISGHPRTIAQVSQLLGGGDRFRLERTCPLDLPLSSNFVEHEVTLVARVQRQPLARNIPPGWDELGPLPWVFAAYDDEPQRFRLVTQGQARLRDHEALVALPDGARLESIEGAEGTWTEVGSYNRIERRQLVRVRGHVLWILEDDERGTIRTNVEPQPQVQYRWVGRTLPGTERLDRVFLGCPRLSETLDASGLSSTIEADQLEWRPVSGSRRWRPMSSWCRGQVWLRYSRGGEVLFRSCVTVLPEEAKVELEQVDVSAHGRHSQGRLHVRGWGTNLVDVLVSSASGTVEVSRQSEGQGLERVDVFDMRVAGTAPRVLTLIANWTDGSSAQLDLPFPVSDARFVAFATGRIVEHNQPIYWEHLKGLRAEAWSYNPGERFHLTWQLRNASDLDVSYDSGLKGSADLVVHQHPYPDGLDLTEILPQIRSLFAATQSLDSTIDLRLISNDTCRGPRLLLGRYWGRVVSPEDEEDCFALKDEDSDELMATDAQLRMEAIALWNPELRLDLERSAPDRWHMPQDAEPGPWLVLGWQSAWCRFRPKVTLVQGEPTGEASELQNISGKTWRNERLQAFNAYLTQCMEEPSDAPWNELARYLAAGIALPATLFDFIECVIARPEALPYIMLELDSTRFNQVWRAMETTPLDWSLVPTLAWLRAFEARIHRARRLIDELAGAFPPDKAQTMAMAPVVQALRDVWEQPQTVCVAELVSERLNLPITSWTNPSLPIARSEQGRLLLIADRDAQLNALRVRHAHSKQRWPDWGNLNKLRLECLERIPQDAQEFVHTLFPSRTFNGPRFQRAVLDLPTVVALACLAGMTPPREMLYAIRARREFDVDWFHRAYSIAMALLLASPWCDALMAPPADP